MKILLLVAAVILGVYLFTGGDWGTDKIFGPPGTLPLTRYDKIGVNVYFYFPDESEVYLGETQGAWVHRVVAVWPMHMPMRRGYIITAVGLISVVL